MKTEKHMLLLQQLCWLCLGYSLPFFSPPTFQEIQTQSKGCLKNSETLLHFFTSCLCFWWEKLREKREMDGREEVKRFKPSFPLSFWELSVASTVLIAFVLGLFGVYFTMTASDYSFLKLPRSLQDLQIRRDHLETYTNDYTIQVLVGYCVVYIFMQTFMIPGTVFMSLLAGALFGVFKGIALVVFTATAGASSCYFLSKVIGRPLVFALWPDKLSFFQDQVAQRRERLLSYNAFPKAYSNFAKYIHQCSFAYRGCALPYFLLGNLYWTHPCCLLNCQGWNSSWRVTIGRGPL